MELDKQLLLAVQDGIREGLKSKLGSQYNNPLDPMINDLLKSHSDSFRQLFAEAIGSAVGDPEFRKQIAEQVRHKLANILVARFGGELEKQVNLLKSDPATRARITVAIEDIMKERMPELVKK